MQQNSFEFERSRSGCKIPQEIELSNSLLFSSTSYLATFHMIKISSAQCPAVMPTILPSQQSKSLVSSSAWKTRALVNSTRRYEAPPRRLLMSRIYAQDSTEKAWSLGLLEWAGKAVPQGPLVMAAKQSWKSIWLVFMNELAPQDKTGGYKRPTYRFNKNRLGDSEFPVSAGSGRYVLMIGGPCPWCHRVLMAAELRGLISGEIIDIVQLVDNPEKASRGGWVFQTKEDPYFGCSDLRQVYDLLCKEEGGFLGRCTAPLLVDTVSKSIISNESSEILEMFDEIHVEGVTSSIQLRPAHLRAEIDEFNSRIFDALNNGVYKCGFATKQSAYDAAYKALEETLRELDTLFSTSRFVMGTAFTDSDLRLFATISRFDAVYSTLFKCVRRITEYPHIHRWFQDCARLKLPGHGSHRYLSSTVDIDDCRRSYFTQLFPLNPGGIIPSGPTSSDILPPAGGWEQQGAEEPWPFYERDSITS